VKQNPLLFIMHWLFIFRRRL